MKKVLFYFPRHFNRTAKGTNPYFDPIIDICHRAGIAYDIYEEHSATRRPHDRRAKRARIFLTTVLVLRRLMRLLMPGRDFFARERLVARVLNILTCSRFKRDVYVTVSGSMYHLFAAMNPRGIVYDMQHGILGRNHPTFFNNDGKLLPQYRDANKHFLFWGEGFRNAFVGEDSQLGTRCHVVGTPMWQRRTAICENPDRLMLVSLQFVGDRNTECLQADKEILRRFLADISQTDWRVLLKKHPCHGGCIDITDLMHEFHNVEITDKPMAELASQIRLHVSSYSTTIFDYAAFGVPSFLLPATGVCYRERMFYGEYAYPLFADMNIEETLELIEADYAGCSSAVREWYEKYCTSLDRDLIYSLLAENGRCWQQ